MPLLHASSWIRGAIAAALVGLVVCATATPVAAQSAATRYERATAREKAARASNASAATLRSIARAYEAIVRAYPRSGYSDNALWQAAGLYELAYQRSRSAADLGQARRMLTWLRKEYPTGTLARQVNRRMSELNAAAKPAPKPTAKPAPRPQPLPVASKPAPAPAPVRPAAEPPAPPQVAAAAAAADTTPSTADALDAGAPAEDDSDEEVASEDAAPPDAAPAVFVRSSERAVDAVPALAPPAPSVAPSGPVAPAPPLLVDAGIAVREITRVALPKGDRVTIELGRETTYVARRDGTRVQIDIPDASLAAGVAERAAALGGPLVKSVAVVAGEGAGARVLLELNGDPRFSTFPLYNPFRLVVDVEAEEPVQTAAARHVPATAPAPAPAAPGTRPSTTTAPAAPPRAAAEPTPSAPPPTTPSSTSRGDYSLARQLGLGVSKIVIDPGHGGHDPGARSNGVNEAEIVLDVALRVEKLLRAQPGFDVVLTRRTDKFIPLEERTAIANREEADMFLSIHANSSPRRATRGVETYLLDFASNPDAEALAARENATSAQTMRLLPDIVKTIALNNKVDESLELARLVQTSLVRRLSPLSKEFQDLGVKRAPFVVLIGAQMPSVLAEISFLTNRTDASLLKQAAHRQRIAEALADAVLRYRASLKGAPEKEPTKAAARR